MSVSRPDLDRLVAIDVHAHAEVSDDGHPSLSAELEAGKAAYFAELDIKEEVRPMILKENAIRVLRLGGGG